jgi:hypothetical protein
MRSTAEHTRHGPSCSEPREYTHGHSDVGDRVSARVISFTNVR